MSKTRRNYVLDATLFSAVSVTLATGVMLWWGMRYQPHTVPWGMARPVWIYVHSISGIFLLTATVVHVYWHRQWLKVLRGRHFRELPVAVRTNRLVDRAIWIAFIATTVFGLLAWGDQAINAANVPTVFVRIHVVTAMGFALLTLWHVALHRKWAIKVTRRMLVEFYA
jgi:hypothetical protein